jgi:hypothetical protein
MDGSDHMNREKMLIARLEMRNLKNRWLAARHAARSDGQD